MTPFLEKFREIVRYYEAENITLVLEQPLYDRLKIEIGESLPSIYMENISEESFFTYIETTDVYVHRAETTPAFKELERFL